MINATLVKLRGSEINYMNFKLNYKTDVTLLRQAIFFFIINLLILVPIAMIANGQNEQSASSTPTPATVPVPMPTPIALAEVVTKAETVSTNLREIETQLASDQISITVEEELPILTSEIDAKFEENSKVLNSRPSLEALRNLETDWLALSESLPVWKSDLTTRATQLEKEIVRLNLLNKTWELTLEVAKSSETPEEILQRMQEVILAIMKTREAVEKRRAQILKLQTRVAEQDSRITEANASIKRMRDETVNRLFVKDSPPIWGRDVLSRAGKNLVVDSQHSFSTQLMALRVYAGRQKSRFILHGFIFILLVAGLYWARRKVQPWIEDEPKIKHATQVFDTPIATALVVSILMSGWIYPQAPRILSAILGAAALVPTIIILRQLIERYLFPILNALMVFYFIDLLRTIASSLPLLSRLLFLVEMFGGIIFLVWLIRSAELSKVSEEERDRLWKTTRFGARLALVIFAATFIANALGYVSIASLIGNATLGSIYIAVIFYGGIRIADGLIAFASRVRPFVLLGMVHRNRRLLRRHVQRFLRWIVTLGWFFLTLELLSLRAPFLEKIGAILTAELSVGALHIALGDVVAFAITVWAAFLLSRFIRFILEEDVFSRINLARGVPYAVSTMLHYAILFVGFLLALAALGIDMTKFTILAGAFGVGLGFGLQNIVNNFVSGLILLFERPVKVGDVVQLGEYSGDLRRIGLRASVLRTWEGSEVIVPNGHLISDEVINWTLTDQQRRIEINVGVAYGTDPEQVIELLTKAVSSHTDVMTEPSPQTLFIGFGDNALEFQVRTWTSQYDRWQVIKSDLTVAVNTALRDANISIPFPQRDLHLQSISDEAVKTALGNRVNQTNEPSSAKEIIFEEKKTREE